MKILAVIPARFASTRLPGKPLKLIGGKPMIQRVYEQVSKCKAITKTIVATDDSRIINCVNTFGGAVCETAANHPSGTDRCIEVLEKQKQTFDVILNVQGDEPFIRQEQLLALIQAFENPETEIATLKKKIDSETEIFDANTVKVVTTIQNNALYFSRNPIPFNRGKDKKDWLEQAYFKHLGVYAFKNESLRNIKNLKPTFLEKTESLEQLRWLENGLHIKVIETNFQSPSVDTEEDLLIVENFLKKHPEYL